MSEEETVSAPAPASTPAPAGTDVGSGGAAAGEKRKHHAGSPAEYRNVAISAT